MTVTVTPTGGGASISQFHNDGFERRVAPAVRHRDSGRYVHGSTFTRWTRTAQRRAARPAIKHISDLQIDTVAPKVTAVYFDRTFGRLSR